MECVDRALKSSFRPEFLVKTPQTHLLIEDLWPVNGGQTGVSAAAGDDFFVDGFLDFSKDDGFVEENDKVEEEGDGVSLPENEETVVQKMAAAGNFSVDGSVSVPESGLCVPADDVAELEWLSHFVDDSSPGYSLTYPAGKLPEKPKPAAAALPLIPVPANPSSFTTPVQTKARSKRTRTGGRVWSLGSPSLTDSATSSSSSSSCTSNPWLIYNDFTQTAESIFGKPPLKKPKKKKPAAENGGGGQQPRRCSHCLVTKTPQWRTGPLGAKTLCNACGVRFKSGRLLPEYRPACSPTFSSEVHSNNHRKVLEMRRKKEGETGLGQPVQSF